MQLEALYACDAPQESVICGSSKTFYLERKAPRTSQARRLVLSHVFEAMLKQVKPSFKDISGASSFVRQMWREEIQEPPPWDLPAIISEDGFIRYYAEGRPLTFQVFKRIWKRIIEGPFEVQQLFNPISINHNEQASQFFDVKATPPGLRPKLMRSSRIKKDPELLNQVQSDLRLIATVQDLQKRRLLSLAILAHGASYRELEGQVLCIPSFTNPEPDLLIPYAFRHHFLWEGIKTISAKPLENEYEEPGLYLCQGTEIWPSQPSTLSSLFANLGKQGSATEPYAYCWKQIHRHLRELVLEGGPLPIVAGHSMGGSLASQIALYSHPLISSAYAFNPPVVEERDYRVYHRLSREAQKKLLVFANLDDLPFWRIGSKVIGQVTLFLSAKRWKYRPVRNWELLLVAPALVKALINLVDAFPSHQSIYPLTESSLSFQLSSEEIEKENLERVLRPDHLYFFHKLHPSARALIAFTRKHFKWIKYEDYLRSQIEILKLHEEDLRDTLAIEGSEESLRSLDEIHQQKESIIFELKRFNK